MPGLEKSSCGNGPSTLPHVAAYLVVKPGYRNVVLRLEHLRFTLTENALLVDVPILVRILQISPRNALQTWIVRGALETLHRAVSNDY
jgi:hypothetical protein